MAFVETSSPLDRKAESKAEEATLVFAALKAQHVTPMPNILQKCNKYKLLAGTIFTLESTNDQSELVIFFFGILST